MTQPLPPKQEMYKVFQQTRQLGLADILYDLGTMDSPASSSIQVYRAFKRLFAPWHPRRTCNVELPPGTASLLNRVLQILHDDQDWVILVREYALFDFMDYVHKLRQTPHLRPDVMQLLAQIYQTLHRCLPAIQARLYQGNVHNKFIFKLLHHLHDNLPAVLPILMTKYDTLTIPTEQKLLLRTLYVMLTRQQTALSPAPPALYPAELRATISVLRDFAKTITIASQQAGTLLQAHALLYICGDPSDRHEAIAGIIAHLPYRNRLPHEYQVQLIDYTALTLHQQLALLNSPQIAGFMVHDLILTIARQIKALPHTLHLIMDDTNTIRYSHRDRHFARSATTLHMAQLFAHAENYWSIDCNLHSAIFGLPQSRTALYTFIDNLSEAHP